MDHKLDKYFREQLSQREHPFQEAYWEAARTLLQRRKRRRRLFFWLFFGMGVIAVAWLLWPVSEITAPPQQVERAIAQPKAPSANERDAIARTAPKAGTTTELAGNSTPGTAGPTGERNLYKNRSANLKGIVPSVNEAPSDALPSAPREQRELTTQTDTPVSRRSTVGNLASLPCPAPGTLSLPWEQRFVKPLERKSKAWLLQNWSVELSQVFTAEHRQPLNRNGYRLVLRKDHRLEQGIYLFGSAGYEYRSGTFEASKVAVGRNYRFGLELDSQFLKPNSLHFLELSVGAGFGRKHHQVELSLSPRYLMGVRGERGFYRRVENTHPPEKEFVPVEAGWLVEDGFRRLAFAAGAAYWFRFNQRTAAGFSAHFQPGGLMVEGYSPPVGNYILKESGEWTFRLSARLGF